MAQPEVMTKENLRAILRDLALAVRSLQGTYDAHKHYDACVETLVQFIDLQFPEPQVFEPHLASFAVIEGGADA